MAEKRVKEISVLFHNIRSSYNVGAMLRTLDAIGASKVYFSGYTPLPTDRFGFPEKQIAKTALGAERSISWEKVASPTKLITHLKQEGFVVVGIEQDPRALDYKRVRPPKGKTLLVVGNEVRGMSSALRRVCDSLVEIPMHGKKESLNVSVAFGILLFRLFDH